MPLAVDVGEDAFAFTFTADVPGVQRSAVKVSQSSTLPTTLDHDQHSLSEPAASPRQRQRRRSNGATVSTGQLLVADCAAVMLSHSCRPAPAVVSTGLAAVLRRTPDARPSTIIASRARAPL